METVSIRVPASPEFVQVVRLVAAGLAARLHFTLDEIADLKIGVDELTAYLTGPQGRDGDLEIIFSVGEDRLQSGVIEPEGRYAYFGTRTQPGQVVTFSDPSRAKKLITHRVRSVNVVDGTARFVTRGDANTGVERWSLSAAGLWRETLVLSVEQVLLHSCHFGDG
jgi:hypothetical protein